jgi:hypothetical protein
MRENDVKYNDLLYENGFVRKGAVICPENRKTQPKPLEL